MQQNTSQTEPTFSIPVNACDCHTHVFENPAIYPLSRKRTYTPDSAPLEALLVHLKKCGLARVVLVQPSPYGSDNTCLLDALRRIPKSGRGVAVIDRNTTNTQLQEMHECGVRGVRVNLQTQGINDPSYAARKLEWASSRVAAWGWHVQLFTNLPVLEQLHDVILGLPTDVVVDHFAHAQAQQGPQQTGFPMLLDLMTRGKIWVKVSAAQRISVLPDCADAGPIARAFIAANPDRVIWGSDWPHPGAKPGQPRNPDQIEPFNLVDDMQALNRLADWAGSNQTLKKILVDNPRTCYGFN